LEGYLGGVAAPDFECASGGLDSSVHIIEAAVGYTAQKLVVGGVVHVECAGVECVTPLTVDEGLVREFVEAGRRLTH